MVGDFVERFIRSSPNLPETDARLGKIPPGFVIATGHDDDVMVFIVRVGDPTATASAILPLITMSESTFILEEFGKTKGLIHKRISVDAAQRLKESLSSAGTEIEFVRPIQE